ncbi:hypothetical protein V565_224440 [Rhizoctonia solani 123E]|uniref:Uncharacterized protein n=1 Tax=Rhizoctonia solani 123E TaxID=1423351 RepID=A0A074RGW1_9AGAM|nr:hypothetical protein V565_224440 [Rhizoctonia solani 123E]
MSILPSSRHPSHFTSKTPRGPTMTFTDKWGEGAIFDWYREQKNKTVMVTRLQIRIDNGKPPHRFVLAYLEDGTVIRLDRRPRKSNSGTLVFQKIRAADDWLILTHNEVSTLNMSTICEIDMPMPPNTDLVLIISVCFALARDKEARIYDLLKYNCYFFSWTVLLVVSRRALPFSIPSPDEVVSTLSHEFDALSHSITKRAVKGVLGIVCNIITAVRGVTAGSSVKQGFSPVERLIWGLPTRLMHFLIHQALRLQLYLGLENEIDRKIKEGLTDVCRSILNGVWENRITIEEQVQQRLWIKELIQDFEPTLRTELSLMIWEAKFDILASTLEPLHERADDAEALCTPSRMSRLKSRLFGDKQMIQVWNKALSAGVTMSREAAQGKAREFHANSSIPPGSITPSYYIELHNTMFDLTYELARTASLNIAKGVVEQTQAGHKNPKRAKMWEEIWRIYDKAWDAARNRTRESVVQLHEAGIEETVALVTQHLVATIGDIEKKGLRVSVQNGKKEHMLISVNGLQEYLSQSIDLAYAAVPHNIPIIHQTMARVWEESRTKYQSVE